MRENVRDIGAAVAVSLATNHSRLFLRARSFTKANDNSNNRNEELKKKINRNLYEVLAFFHYHIMGYEFCNQPREGAKEKLYL